MNRTAESPENAASWVPVQACTLPTAEQPLRVAEFDDLFGAALHAVEWREGHASAARLVLVGHEGLTSRVQQLVDAESACCSFFSFTVSEADQYVAGAKRSTVVLDIEVPLARADVLAGLIARAEQFLHRADA